MEFKRECWTKKDYEDLKSELRELAEEDFRIFQLKLIPGTDNILGVRTPKLKEIAIQIAKGDWSSFLQQVENNTFEETMLEGFVIGKIKTDFETILELSKAFVAKINNWAVCDLFCSNLKSCAKNKESTWEFIQPYLSSHMEYELRFAVVLGMDYLVEEKYLDKLFESYNKIKLEAYYVKMAVAWAISLCYVKFGSQTELFLLKNNLDDFTFNKALQKIVESNRVEEATKVRIRKMKRR